LYALLLFGGHIAVDHVRGGLTVGGVAEGALRLRAWPRIAILVQQLRCVSPPFILPTSHRQLFETTTFIFILFWQTAIRCGAIALT
jgi:hypothetical protein